MCSASVPCARGRQGVRASAWHPPATPPIAILGRSDLDLADDSLGAAGDSLNAVLPLAVRQLWHETHNLVCRLLLEKRKSRHDRLPDLELVAHSDLLRSPARAVRTARRCSIACGLAGTFNPWVEGFDPPEVHRIFRPAQGHSETGMNEAGSLVIIATLGEGGKRRAPGRSGAAWQPVSM